MIAFGCAITKQEVYRRCARPGIELAAEQDSAIYELQSTGSLFSAYNELLEKAAPRDDLEALVLVHQDAEIVDNDFCSIVRGALEDPQVGVVGCVGAIGVRSIAWWEASVTCASFIHRYGEHGGGDLPSGSWDWSKAPPWARVGEVDTVDGFVLVLAPWVVRNIRFDEALGRFHGYDLDLCLQVREAGRKVMSADFRAIHHHSLEFVPDFDQWIEAHIKVATKWDGRMGIGAGVGTWKERALRANAERDAAWLLKHMNELDGDAAVAQLERALAETRESISWRLTAPLRWVGKLRFRAAGTPRLVRAE